MAPCRTVSYYREMDKVVVTVRSGKIKFFNPTSASTDRLAEVLRSLDTEDRVDIGFATIYGGGIHAWVDPAWLKKKAVPIVPRKLPLRTLRGPGRSGCGNE